MILASSVFQLSEMALTHRQRIYCEVFGALVSLDSRLNSVKTIHITSQELQTSPFSRRY